MSELQFPKDPIVGQQYDFPPYKYYWDGVKWKTMGIGYNPVNDLRDEVLPTTREAIRRSYAEAGLNLVDGSFEEGGVLTSTSDVLLHKASGIAYSGPIGSVVAGTDPTVVGSGYVQRKDVELRSDLAGDGGSRLSGYRNGTVYDALDRKIYADVFKLSAEVDYTGAIQRGIQHCIDNSISTLYFKSGIYLVSDALGNCPVNFVSDGKTVIRNTNTATLGSANNKKIITFTNGFTVIKGVVFDGQVSATANTYNQDPSSWNNSNYETWYGMQGPVISGASGFSIIDSDATNFYRHGFYITGCNDFTIVRPKTKRNRGNFGDGIFIGNGCYNFTVIGSSARDFTRGGLVCDMGCYDFTILGNSATYGHDWSALYGGTEYAAGMWLEKSTRGTASGSRLTDCGYFGAIMSLEIEGFMPVPYREYLTLSLEGARVDGGFIGVNCTSAEGSIGKISVTNVDSSVQSGKTAMLLRGHAGIIVDVVGGSATVSGNTAGACIAVGALGQNGRAPIYNLTSVGVGHTTQVAAADVKSKIATQYVGDICLYTIAEYDFELNINDVYSLSDSKEILVGLVASRITPSWHSPLIAISSPRHKVYYVDSSEDAKTAFHANGAEFSKLKVACNNWTLTDCDVTDCNIRFPTIYKYFKNKATNVTFNGVGNYLTYTGVATPYNYVPVFMLDGCTFRGDLSSPDTFLVDIRRVDAGGTRIGWMQRNTVFINLSGITGSNSAAIYNLLFDYALPAWKTTNVFDILVGNVRRTGTTLDTDPVVISYGVSENLVLSD